MDTYLPTLDAFSRLSLTLAIITSVYLIRKTNSDPNPPPTTSTKQEQINSLKKADFLMTAGNELTIRRHLNFVTFVGLYHALLSGLPDQQRPALCPNYTTNNVTPSLFTWTKHTTTALSILFLASLLRLSAYTNLGPSFTFYITKPTGLKTTGVHRYIRHPSYTGIFGIALSTVLLFFRANGLMGCWVPAAAAQVVDQVMLAWAVVVMPGMFWVRVKGEEEFLGRMFGKEWEGYCARTQRFIPGVF